MNINDIDPYWRPAVPRVLRVLRDMKREGLIRDYNYGTVERVFIFLAQEHDPRKLYGKRLRELIDKGFDWGEI